MVYGLGAKCAALSVEEDAKGHLDVRLTPAPDTMLFGNNVTPPAPPYSMTCKYGAVVTYVDVEARTFVFGNGSGASAGGPFVSRLRVGCSRMEINEDLSVAWHAVDPFEIGMGTPNAFRGLVACPDGALATQFTGRSGAYIDAFGLECSELKLRRPLPEVRPEVRTPVAAGLAIVVFLLLASSVRGSRSLTRWLPSIATTSVVGSAMVERVAAVFAIDRPLFCVYLVLAFAVTVLTAVPFPGLVRVVAGIPPFHAAVPLLLRSARLRRRVFGGYLERIATRLDRESKDANAESYVPLPAVVVCANGSVDVGEPAKLLVKNLVTRAEADRRPKILIEGGGGRGKSAILRAVLRSYLEEYRGGANVPIPVLCDFHGRTWEEIIGNSLGAYKLSDDALASLLRAGDLVVFADGMSESNATAQMLHTFLFGPAGENVGVVLASRPNPELAVVFRDTNEWRIVEPKLLNDSQMQMFTLKYAHADKRPAEQLPDMRRMIEQSCRNRDGLYAPVLVRLAMLAHTQDPSARSIATIYERAFERLVRKAADVDDAEYARLRETAIAFALESYWAHGSRTGSIFSGNSSRVADLARLRRMGVLISGETTSLLGSPVGGSAAFFHDSMQSYFAAIGLRTRQETEYVEILTRAASARLFVKDRSDLFGYVGSELFCMCIELFEPSFWVDHLQATLAVWAEKFDGALMRDEIAQNLPADFRSVHERSVVVRGMSGGKYISSVISTACNHPDERPKVFASVFASVAPVVGPSDALLRRELRSVA